MSSFLHPQASQASFSSSQSSRNSSESLGLPADEYHQLLQAQGRSRLESHFGHPGSNPTRNSTSSNSSYRNAGLSQPHRRNISQVRSATREALGPSFDFDKDSYRRPRTTKCERSDDWDNDRATSSDIPQKYIDEFNRRWHEDDEDNDADQYMADTAANPLWRRHERLDAVNIERHRTVERSRRIDSGHGYAYNSSPKRPQLKSRFSFDEDDEHDTKRGFGSYFRRG